jgi:hypothetical protein
MAEKLYPGNGRKIGRTTDGKKKEYLKKLDESYPTDGDSEYEMSLSKADLVKIEFAFRFYKMNAISVDIISFLHRSGGEFQGNYSDFTRALGRKGGPNGHESNIRKVCLDLQAKGILILTFAESGRVKTIELNKYWTSKV